MTPDRAYAEQVKRDLERLVRTLDSHPAGRLCAKAVLGLVNAWLARGMQ